MSKLHEPNGPKPGYFEATRSEEALELLQLSPCAFLLAYIIAYRANWRGGYNQRGCGPGEAFIGDYENCGLKSERSYRTAKQQLAKGGFAKFRTTNRGTIGRLLDARLFKVNLLRATSERRAADDQVATNLKPENVNHKIDKASPTKPTKLSATQKELADRAEKALGEQWLNDAGKWIHRIKSEFGKSERVFNEVESAIKEGRIKTTPAQYAEQQWKEFR